MPRDPWQATPKIRLGGRVLACRLVASAAFAVVASGSVQAGPPPACTGDCGADEAVSIDELVLGVRIALGDLPATRCAPLDLDADGMVNVAEIVAAVANSLVGCGPRIALGSASGFRLQEVAVPIEMRKPLFDVVRIDDLTFRFDGRSLSFVGCVSSLPGKNAHVLLGQQTVVLDIAGDSQPIPNGVFASCMFTILDGAPADKAGLVYESAVLVGAGGDQLQPAGLNGGVLVVIPTPTPSNTETNTPSPTRTNTPSRTPTPTFTPPPTVNVEGLCQIAGVFGQPVPCFEKRVVVSACRSEDCHDPECVEEPAPCVRDPARRTVLAEGRTGADGVFSIGLPDEAENSRLLFEAEVADGVIYRTIAVGAIRDPDQPRLVPRSNERLGSRGDATETWHGRSLGESSSAGGAQAEPSILVDPSSEGVVALLSRGRQPCDPGGSGPTVACEPLLEDTSDDAIQELVGAVRDASRGGSAYAGLDAAGAIGAARGLAVQVAGVRIEQALFRAADGTIYHVVAAAGAARNLGSSEGEAFRVTTLAASSSSPVESCVALPSQASGPMSALAGASALRTQSSVSRTSVVAAPSVRILLREDSFDPSGSGRITVATDASALSICASAPDCAGAPGQAPVSAMTANDARVRSACTARAIVDPCGGAALDGFAFGLPSTGACPTPPTDSTSACGAAPADGFSLSPGEAIVFIYRDVGTGSGFSAGVGGFEIDRDGANPFGCATLSVVSSGARVQTLPSRP